MATEAWTDGIEASELLGVLAADGFGIRSTAFIARSVTSSQAAALLLSSSGTGDAMVGDAMGAEAVVGDAMVWEAMVGDAMVAEGVPFVPVDVAHEPGYVSAALELESDRTEVVNRLGGGCISRPSVIIQAGAELVRRV